MRAILLPYLDIQENIMPSLWNGAIDQLIIPAVVRLMFIGGVIAVVISIALMLRSPKVFQVFNLMNRYVSSRHAAKTLAIPRDSGPFIWKNLRPIGTVFSCGATYSLWGLLTGPENAQIASVLNRSYPPDFVLWIVTSARYLLIVGCIVSFIVGALMILHPETLRTIENISARWYSPRQILHAGERMNMTLDNWVTNFPRAAGLIIVFPGLVTTLYFGELVFTQM